MPMPTIDTSAEDYEILSIHSSDNELMDETASDAQVINRLRSEYGRGMTDKTGNAKSGDKLPDSQSDQNLQDSIDTLTRSKKSGSNIADSCWCFPSTELKPQRTEMSVMPSLSEGIDSLENDASVMSPRNALLFPAMPLPPEKYWREVLLPVPSDQFEVRYIIMCGVYRLQFQPMITKVHEAVPQVQLLWLDTETLHISWITDRIGTLPKRRKLLKQAIRMDFYASESDHLPETHHYIDSTVLHGFKDLATIPVCPHDADFSGDVPASLNAPIEVDAFGKKHALSFLSSVRNVELSHLNAVLKYPKTSPVKSLVRPNSRSLLSQISARQLYFLLFGPLLFIFGYTQLCMILGYDFWISDLLGLGHRDISSLTAHPAATSTATDLSLWEERKALTLKTIGDLKMLPSAVRVPTLDEIEELLRSIAIYIHKLTSEIRSWSGDGATWIKTHAQIDDFAAVKKARERLAESFSRMVEQNISPLWSLGRKHAAQWARER